MAKKRVTTDLIDKQKFESLVRLGLSHEELIQFFMVNSGQLWQWIKLTYNTRTPLVLLKKIRVEGKVDFLLKQRKLAEKNPSMSIWFGKNYYDQKDELQENESADYEDLNPLVELLKDDSEGQQIDSEPVIEEKKEDADNNN